MKSSLLIYVISLNRQVDCLYVKNTNTEAANDLALAERYRARFQEAIDFIDGVFPHGLRRNPEEKSHQERGSKPLRWDHAMHWTSALVSPTQTSRTRRLGQLAKNSRRPPFRMAPMPLHICGNANNILNRDSLSLRGGSGEYNSGHTPSSILEVYDFYKLILEILLTYKSVL